ncbi:AP2 domain protein [compost metagenome]
MSCGWFEGADIDRIDFDLSYSKDNCRWVNRDIGNHNKSKPQDCTSIFKGVYYDKARDKWVARVNRNGTVYLQKRYNTEIEAALAYDNISEEIYGDRPNKTTREDSQK